MQLNTKIFAALNLLLVLAVGTWQVWQKESILRQGELLLLELAPVDPLSLMQGYYMDLRYEAARNISYDSIPSRGYMVFERSENNVGQIVSVEKSIEALEEGQIPVKYFYNNFFVSIGAEAFFFEEGTSENYSTARYGALYVDQQGNSVLAGLYGQDMQPLGPAVAADSLSN